jgi:MFS transporter, ACS family, hexuronate transporter
VEGGRIGAVSGFVYLIANLAGIVAPMATGFLQASCTFTSAFVLTGGIAVLGPLGVAIFVRQPASAEAAVPVVMEEAASRALKNLLR